MMSQLSFGKMLADQLLCDACQQPMKQTGELEYTCISGNHVAKIGTGKFQGLAQWTDKLHCFSYPAPSPLGQSLDSPRPCHFCGGNMVPSIDVWVCSQNLRHRAKLGFRCMIWTNGAEQQETGLTAWANDF